MGPFGISTPSTPGNDKMIFHTNIKKRKKLSFQSNLLHLRCLLPEE